MFLLLGLLVRLLRRWERWLMRQRPEHRAQPTDRQAPTNRTYDFRPTWVAEMTSPATLGVAEQQITEALAELRAARLDHEHSPTTDNALTVEYAEMRLNRMLDRYCGCGADGMPKPAPMAGR